MLVPLTAFARAAAGQSADDYRGGWRTGTGEAHLRIFDSRRDRQRPLLPRGESGYRVVLCSISSIALPALSLMNANAVPGLSRMSKAIFTPFACSSASTAGRFLTSKP